MNGFSEWATPIPDEHLDLFRELISYDVLCPASVRFVRIEPGALDFEVPPSSFHWSRQCEWPWALVHGNFQETDTVLDVGSGWSIFKFALAKRCSKGKVICLDNDSEGLAVSRKTIAKIGSTNIEQVLGDARNLPFPDNSIDKVVCVSVIEHIKDAQERCIQEAIRVLKPGGIYLLTMDLVVDGKPPEGNFFISPNDVGRLVRSLGISPPKEELYYMADLDGIILAVLMIKYTKPLQ